MEGEGTVWREMWISRGKLGVVEGVVRKMLVEETGGRREKTFLDILSLSH